nr:hypothetical protein [Tanacetum cinerariifolium]
MLMWKSCCGGMMVAEVVSVMVVTSGYWWICSGDVEWDGVGGRMGWPKKLVGAWGRHRKVREGGGA